MREPCLFIYLLLKKIFLVKGLYKSYIAIVIPDGSAVDHKVILMTSHAHHMISRIPQGVLYSTRGTIHSTLDITYIVECQIIDAI